MERLPEALVVERDPKMRKALADALLTAGVARVVEASAAEEALEHFARARTRAAFIGGAGTTDERAALCAEMLSLDAHALVVGLSLENEDADADERFVRSVLRAGAFGVVPREPDALRRVVAEMVNEARLARLV